MAKFKGTSGEDDLFGTARPDLLRGMGGEDRIQGNGGDDRISGFGTIFGNNGDDHYSFVGYENLGSTKLRKIDLGSGNDRAVFNHSVWTDAEAPVSSLGYGFSPVDLGSGRDTVILSGEMNGSVNLGDGADTLWVSATSFMGVRASLGNVEGAHDDGAKDVVHVDAGSDAYVDQFGRNDVIVIHGTDITVGEVLKRVTFLSSGESSLVISLPGEVDIGVGKYWSGNLTKDNIRIVEKPWSVKMDAMIEHEAAMTSSRFLSVGDNTIRKPTEAIFANLGNDKIIGSKLDDRIWGEGGDDRLIGNGGDDELFGGRGVDLLSGGRGKDILTGGEGDDFLFGGSGNDHFVIDHGADIAKGGRGADIFEIADRLFVTGARLSGGRGDDTFVFVEPDHHFAFDAIVVIEDFRPDRDTIDLRRAFNAGESRSDRKAAIVEALEKAREVTADENDYAVDGLALFAGAEIYLAGLHEGDLSLSDFVF